MYEQLLFTYIRVFLYFITIGISLIMTCSDVYGATLYYRWQLMLRVMCNSLSYFAAIHSTSTSTPFGNVFTATAERAG